MANQIEHEPLAERIDEFLTYVTSAWATIPDDAAEWDEWDEESRLVYRFEWTIPRDRWHDLERWVAEGCLTSEQHCRFEEIKTLMEAHGATLARLLDPNSDHGLPEQSPIGTATSGSVASQVDERSSR